MIKKPSEIPKHKTALFDTDTLFDPNRMLNAYVDRNLNIGWHAHKFYEINIIVGGSGIHYYGDEWVGCSTGDIYIIPPFLRHAYISNENLDVYHLIFRPSFFSKHHLSLQKLRGYSFLFETQDYRGTLSTQKAKSFHIDEIHLKKIIKILDDASEVLQKDASTTLIAECYAIIAIANLCEQYVNESNLFSSGTDALFTKSVERIYNSYYENISTDQLAKICGMSRSAYVAKFKAIYQMTPKQFVLRERINAAKSLLLNSTENISIIAEKTGFYDTSHFVKCFSSTVGTTPLEYRHGKVNGNDE